MSQHPVVFEKSYRTTLARERAIARDVYASMMNLGNREAACRDWRQAKDLGEESAGERLARYCQTDS